MSEFSIYLRYGTFEVEDVPDDSDADEPLDREAMTDTTGLAGYFSNLYGESASALYFDEQVGLRTYPDFGLIEEAFTNPTLASQRRYRDAIAGYFKDPELSPAILHRLVERHPETADEAIKRALNRSSFSWEKDSERLLRRYKSDLLVREPMPMLLVLFDEAAVEEGVIPDGLMMFGESVENAET